MLIGERWALIWRGAAAAVLASRSESTIHSTIPFVLLALALFMTSCATKDTEHQIVISAREQKLALLENGNLVATYPISTSKFGLGDGPGSYGTPLGKLEIADKIGDGAPAGTVFKDRRRTGEVVAVDSPGRDPIVTRIIWLRGLRSAERKCLSPRHLHSRHTRGTKHRPPVELRMHSNEISRHH